MNCFRLRLCDALVSDLGYLNNQNLKSQSQVKIGIQFLDFFWILGKNNSTKLGLILGTCKFEKVYSEKLNPDVDYLSTVIFE